MKELFTDKFLPHDFNEFVGNSEVVESVKQWAQDWGKGKQQRPLLFYGATGTGKTCLAILTAKMFGWQLFEFNASNFRTKDTVEKIAGSAAQGASFFGKPRLVLLDEVDGLQGTADRGGAAAISTLLRSAKNPVILTANDIYSDQKIAPLRTQCNLMHFKKINYLSIAKRLRELCALEKIEAEEDALQLLARNCAGDFRSALLDLQTLSLNGKIDLPAVQLLGYRERQQDVFKTIEAIFKGKSLAEIRKARAQSEVSDEMLLRWIEENIPRHFVDGNDTANAFERLSKADVFNGRIMNRQHYGFLRYSSELMTAGVALSREHDYHGWIHYQFPQLLRVLSKSKKERNLKKELCKKIGRQTHSSSREVMAQDLPFMQVFFKEKEKAARFAAQFDLNEEEIAFLLSTKPETKKVAAIAAAAEQLKKERIAEKRKQFAPPLEQPEEEIGEEKQQQAEEGQTKLL
jgi:replication factor C large subunit